jgi:SNF2 family DNA or RNA helicase
LDKVKLLPHQEKSIAATKDFNRCAYYLDMGLGKTFVGSEKLKELNTNINLIICQKSKLQDWYEHFKTYYPEYNTFIYSKTRNIPTKSVIIINYDLVWRRKELLELKDFTLMLDESSCIKNEKSNRTKFILKMKPNNVILLSGTPTGGKYEELYSQCKLLGWKISKKAFWDTYIVTRKMDINGFSIPIVIGYKNVDRLKGKLREYGAIFMKTDEVIDLPEQLDNVVKVESTKEYKKFAKDRVITIDTKNLCEFKDDSDFYGKDVTPRVELVGDTALTKMLYLRQLASQYNSNKLAALKDLLESTNDRLIIFYNFTQELDEIKNLCKKLDKPISVVNGKSKSLKNYESKDNSVTLIQYQAGAMGLNLQKSNKIIYFSLPLSSELFEQSKKRTHRIGQKNSCLYYYLITSGSIDEKIYAVLGQRRDFTNALFEENEYL